jgi:hypothetical protein
MAEKSQTVTKDRIRPEADDAIDSIVPMLTRSAVQRSGSLSLFKQDA